MRENSGRATIPYQEIMKGPTPVVLADAIALLSGVNFSSVEKVIAAMEAIAEATGMPLDPLLKLDDVPINRPVLGAREDTKRLDATGAFVRTVACITDRLDIEDVLRLRARFPCHVNIAKPIVSV